MGTIYRHIAISIIACMMMLSCQSKQESKLTIAIAANMRFVMQEITKSFTSKTGIDVEMITGSSGKLTAQIREGAPFDIFISANMKYPNTLFNAGLTKQKPKIYAYGKLILWSAKDSLKPSIDILPQKHITHIALANPKTAPYGLAAIEVLQHHHIYDSIKEKLVYGESISQTNQFISSEAVILGFTSKSVVFTPKMKNKGHWIELPEASYSPIEQGIVLITHQHRSPKGAEQFYNFLFSKEAQKILEDFGYLISKS